jgi:hypothetical protein
MQLCKPRSELLQGQIFDAGLHAVSVEDISCFAAASSVGAGLKSALLSAVLPSPLAEERERVRGLLVSMNLLRPEEKRDLRRCGFSPIRPMHRILLYVLTPIATDRARRRLRGIGCSHDVTIFCDSAFTL